MKYAAYAKVSGSKFLGVFEANSAQEAEEKALASDAASINLCNHCSEECEDAEVTEISVEEQ